MADRAAWVVQAFRRYHAGQLSLDALLAMVREHRGGAEHGTDDADA